MKTQQIQQLFIFLIVPLLIKFVSQASSLIQAYFSQKPVFEILKLSYEVFELSGCLALISAMYFSSFVNRKLGYALALIGAMLLILSLFGGFFISHQIWTLDWAFFLALALETATISLTFFFLIRKKNKKIRRLLKIITIAIYVAAFVLLVFTIA